MRSVPLTLLVLVAWLAALGLATAVGGTVFYLANDFHLPFIN